MIVVLFSANGIKNRKWKDRLGLTFSGTMFLIHGEGAFCHPHVQMDKMPIKEDRMWPLMGMISVVCRELWEV